MTRAGWHLWALLCWGPRAVWEGRAAVRTARSSSSKSSHLHNPDAGRGAGRTSSHSHSMGLGEGGLGVGVRASLAHDARPLYSPGAFSSPRQN